MKILLGQEVNPDRSDHRGRTSLSRAAQSGDERVVKILLEQEEVNPDKPDIGGRTPLSHAASYGCGVVVGVLLGRGGGRSRQTRSSRKNTAFTRCSEWR